MGEKEPIGDYYSFWNWYDEIRENIMGGRTFEWFRGNIFQCIKA